MTNAELLIENKALREIIRKLEIELENHQYDEERENYETIN